MNGTEERTVDNHVKSIQSGTACKCDASNCSSFGSLFVDLNKRLLLNPINTQFVAISIPNAFKASFKVIS